jgi:hypothetical protein
MIAITHREHEIISNAQAIAGILSFHIIQTRRAPGVKRI